MLKGEVVFCVVNEILLGNWSQRRGEKDSQLPVIAWDMMELCPDIKPLAGKHVAKQHAEAQGRLKAAISQILEANSLTPEQSESFRSRLMFAETRCLAGQQSWLFEPALLGRASEPLSDEVRVVLDA